LTEGVVDDILIKPLQKRGHWRGGELPRAGGGVESWSMALGGNRSL